MAQEATIHSSAHEVVEAVQHAAAGHHEAHELPNFITVLNSWFPDSAAIHFLHRWENLFFSLIAGSLICFIFIRAARQKNMVPTRLQNFCEVVIDGLAGFVTSILGERGRKYVPFLGTLFLYILVMNWSGLIPLSKSPTAAWSTTVALALSVMVYVQAAGIREQGFGHYIKHLAGNPSNIFGLILIPLMLVINLTIEFVAVPLSLSLRLFANVSSEDRLLFKFAELNVLFKGIPFLLQLFANLLALIFSLVQAFVFMLLSTVYISLMMPHDDHAHDEEVAHAH